MGKVDTSFWKGNYRYFFYHYVTLEKSTREIAKELGISQSTVERELVRLGIQRRDKSGSQKVARKRRSSTRQPSD